MMECDMAMFVVGWALAAGSVLLVLYGLVELIDHISYRWRTK